MSILQEEGTGRHVLPDLQSDHRLADDSCPVSGSARTG